MCVVLVQQQYLPVVFIRLNSAYAGFHRSRKMTSTDLQKDRSIIPSKYITFISLSATLTVLTLYNLQLKGLTPKKYQSASINSLKIKNKSTEPMKHEKLISSFTKGRLGNKMGIHAVSLGLAQINGYKPVLDKRMAKELRKYFQLSTPEIDEGSLNITWAGVVLQDYFMEEYSHFTAEYFQIYGYANSWTFFHHIKPVVLKEYTFKQALQDEAQRTLHNVSKIIKRNATFVGVHVRRGDYVRVMLKAWRGVVADKNYLEEAMDIFRERYNDSVFIVVSNDRKWCEDNLNASVSEDIFIVGNSDEESPGQDMALLVACNHTIMTIGTFGFWASYLCGGEVIYLANYTLPDSQLLNVIRYNSTYLPEWLGIAADLSQLATLPTATTIP